MKSGGTFIVKLPHNVAYRKSALATADCEDGLSRCDIYFGVCCVCILFCIYPK